MCTCKQGKGRELLCYSLKFVSTCVCVCVCVLCTVELLFPSSLNSCYFADRTLNILPMCTYIPCLCVVSGPETISWSCVCVCV